MILLSSLHRLRRYLEVDDKPENNRLITNFLTSSSREIQRYVGRELLSQSRTEYFDIEAVGQMEFWPEAVPLSAITSIEYDSTGLFTGSETTLSNFYIGAGSNSFVLDVPQAMGKRVLKIVYTGGVATHGTRSTFTVSSAGVFVADKFVFGSTSGAWGIVVSLTASVTLIVETLYGVFEAAEVLNQAAKEGASAGDGVTATLDTITAQSLAEQIPEYATAVEMQLRYLMRRKDNFELASTQKEGQRYNENAPMFGTHEGLQREVRSTIQHLVRYAL